MFVSKINVFWVAVFRSRCAIHLYMSNIVLLNMIGCVYCILNTIQEYYTILVHTIITKDMSSVQSWFWLEAEVNIIISHCLQVKTNYFPLSLLQHILLQKKRKRKTMNILLAYFITFFFAISCSALSPIILSKYMYY